MINPAKRLREKDARILALKIAASSPNHTASTSFIKKQIPSLYPLSEEDLQPSPTRPHEQRWQQIVGNVVSHKKSNKSLFATGLADRTPDGIRATPKGLEYLENSGL